MKKKLLLGICTFALVLGLTACGSDEEVTYGGHTTEEFQLFSQSYMAQFESIGEADIQQAIDYYQNQSGQDILVTALTDWSGLYDEKGEFVEFGEFELTKSGKTLTSTQIGEYSGRNIKFTVVYNVNKIDEGPTAMNFEYVYSLGETMQKAGLNTVMGILIVFTMLVVMSLIISCFKFIPNIKNAFSGKKDESKETVDTTAAPVVAATDDLELIAVIAAAIAASTGASTDSFVVRSIKKRR